MSDGLCEGRIVIVTGAGRGIGREHALELAQQGASVVVNDVDGEPAREVAAEIGTTQALANTDDVGSFAGAGALVQAALDTFGDLHGIVNNAGIVRDAVLVNMTETDFEAVVRVHLNGTFNVMHHAAVHWREQAKGGAPVDGRVVNTTSASGLFGNPGQANYAAAKAGILGLTQIGALELARYGVTVNAIAPAGRTRMTEALFPPAPEAGFDRLHARNNAPLVAWLMSSQSAGITGRVFELAGGTIRVLEGWRRGPQVDQAERWAPTELDAVVRDLVARAAAPTPAHPT
jgi:NAD(P)-dependent dehydrogenase (short-subunit alcohol dehydrogenase family)